MKISIHHIVTQKVGNSVGFSLPASFKVEVGTEYTIHQKSDGSLILNLNKEILYGQIFHLQLDKK